MPNGDMAMEGSGKREELPSLTELNVRAATVVNKSLDLLRRIDNNVRFLRGEEIVPTEEVDLEFPDSPLNYLELMINSIDNLITTMNAKVESIEMLLGKS